MMGFRGWVYVENKKWRISGAIFLILPVTGQYMRNFLCITTSSGHNFGVFVFGGTDVD
jgi:hypothetical protein